MKNSILFFLSICIVLSACSTYTGGEKKALTSGLYPENMDTTVKPGDNFQMFVNGKWIAETEIPADKSSIGIFRTLRDQSQEDVKAIIEESASGDFEIGSDEQKVGDLYASFMDMETRNKKGVEPIQSWFDKIDGISNKNELATYFAYLGKYGMGSPIMLWVGVHAKKPDQYALHTWQGGLGLPDREYYFQEDEKSATIRNEYIAHIAKMFELAGLPDPAGSAATILKFETTIADKHWKKEANRDRNARFNPFPVDSLDDLMSGFSWRTFLEETGIDNLDNIIVSQPSFTLAVNDLINDTGLATWKTYLKWIVLNENASRLNAELDEQNFKFYGTVMRGTPEQLPMWRRAVNTVNGSLGEVVGKVYVTKHFPPEAKERMDELVGNLITAYEVSINELDWMSTETKMQALDKLSKFTPKIGYPDQWKDYSDVDINADDLLSNLQSAIITEHKREIAKLGGPVDKAEWFITPQTVNAYYNPSMNEIVFPAAILQPPFFDLNADDAANYGAIGGVIGHEIGHGFDDQGSTSDGDGKLRNWWSDSDREEFKMRTGALVDQYNQFKVFDDLAVNGEFTLGENIGDLGGLSIALKAYKLSLEGQEEPVFDGYTGTQRVLLGWAQVWKGKRREESARMQVKTDPHSPAQFRINGVVRNIPEFYEAFNVQLGDSLYLQPEDRVKIW